MSEHNSGGAGETYGAGYVAGQWARANIPDILDARHGEPSIRDAAKSPEWVDGYMAGGAGTSGTDTELPPLDPNDGDAFGHR